MTTSASSTFLHVRRRDDGFEVVGPHALRLGEPLANSEGRNGVWARWDWNGRELTVRNDRGGFRPIYYFARAGEIAVASSLVTLLRQGAPRELDDDALAVFFHVGYFLGEETPFRAIRALPPNSVLRWTGDRVELAVSPQSSRERSSIDRETAIVEYQRLFAQAIRRRPSGGPSAIPLSGGRDSRHILFELCAQGRRADLAATIDLPSNDDGRVAAAVAKMLGVPHQLTPAPPQTVELEQQKNVATDLCADEHSWILALRGPLEGQSLTLYDGIGGDVLSAGLFLEPQTLALFRAGKFVDLARHLIEEEQQAAFVSRFLVANVAERFGVDRAVVRLAAELERHAGAANPCGSFFFENRTRREIALSPFAIFGDFEVHAPYLDVDLVDFLTSLPADLLLDHVFHDDTIARAYPQWAHLPYSRKRSKSPRLADLPLAWRLRRWLGSLETTSLNRAYLLPRLLRAGIDPFYNRRTLTSLITFPVYWAQLEEFAQV